MNWLQRLVLRTLFDQKLVAMIRETWQGDDPVYPAANFANLVRLGFRKNELIFACIATTADSAAQISLRVHNRKDGKVLDDHPLAKLIQRPNPYMSEYDFWSAVIIYQYLAGRAFFEKERNRAGQVMALWPLRPDWVQIIPSSTKMIAGYRYGPPGMPESARVFLKPEDVLDFPVFDPLDQYKGHSPVAVAARIGDVDNSTTDYLKLFWEKGGVPPGYLKTKQKIVNEAEITRIRQRWMERYGGFEKWIGPAVLDSDADYQRAGFSFSEMGFDTLDARSESRICMVLRTPPIIIGAQVGLNNATYSNYETAEKAWWRNRLIPLYTNYQDVVENGLSPEFPGGDVMLRWDMGNVYALQEDVQRKWQRASEALARGGITVNEYRLEIGREPTADGNIYLRPINLIEVPAKLKANGGKALPDLDLPHTHDHPADTPDGKAQKPPDEADRTSRERTLTKEVQAYFKAQQARVEAALREEYGGAAVRG